MNNENRREELTRSQPQRPSARVSTAGRFARWVISLSLLIVVLGWGLQRWPGENWWASAFLTYAPEVLWLLPAALALMVALICRERFLSFIAAILVGFVVVVLMGWQWRTSAPAKVQDSFVVASWNVRNGWRSAKRARMSLDEIGADIILTQEAIDNRFLPYFEGFECVRTRGQRIFIRRQSPLSPGPQDSVPDAPSRQVLSDGLIVLGDGWRPAHQARVQLGDRHISLLDVHLVVGDKYPGRAGLTRHPRSYLHRTVQLRRDQIAFIARWAKQQPGAFIIAGDFNTPPHASVWQPLLPLVTDAFAARGRGFGYTYRRHLPLWRIDYLWVSPHFRVLRCGTFDGGMSDHLGVWAELEFVQ